MLPITRIFHPSDFSPASEIAFAHALKISLIAKAELSIMHVAEDGEELHWLEFPGVRHLLERWKLLPQGSSRSDVSNLGIDVQKILAHGGSPVSAVLHYLAEEPTDMVVLATHQREGVNRWWNRAVAEPIARGSKTITLFVPDGVDGFVNLDDGSITLQHILIPAAQVPPPQDAIEAAADLAQSLGVRYASFTVVYVGNKDDQPKVQLPQQAGWAWETMVRQGHVVEQILEVAAACGTDLIVLSTQGHQGILDALRGSTSERLVRGASCPLLAIPAA